VKESPPPLLSKTERDNFSSQALLSNTVVVINTSLPIFFKPSYFDLMSGFGLTLLQLDFVPRLPSLAVFLS
jgi:hypothetical protein